MNYNFSLKSLFTLTLSTLPLKADTPLKTPIPPSPPLQSNLKITPELNQSQSILNVFKDYILIFDIDKKSIDSGDTTQPFQSFPKGLENLLQKISYFTQQHQPLILIMVGFPYKSANTRDKVTSMKVDAAERYSLTYLQDFLNRIKAVYPPGAKLIIVTDGVVFNDLEKVSDDLVVQYEEDLKTLVSDLSDIEIRTLRDLYPGQTPSIIRDHIMMEKPSLNDFSDQYAFDPKVKEDVHVLSKRMSFELALLQLSTDELFDICFNETHRSLQFSHFLKKLQADFLKLNPILCSVRYQKDLGKKVGLKLSDSHITPWHGVLVEDKNGPTILHRNDVDLSMYEPTTRLINGLSLLLFTRRR